MLALLQDLRKKCAVGFVGGSDLAKQQEQLGRPASIPVTTLFDFCFCGERPHGLSSMGVPLRVATASSSGSSEDNYKRAGATSCLHYVADLDIPVKRGTFRGVPQWHDQCEPRLAEMLRSQERNEYEKFDLDGIRFARSLLQAIKEQFGLIWVLRMFLKAPLSRA